MRLNVSLLVVAGAAVNGVFSAPVTINDDNAPTHQLTRRAWWTFAKPTLKQVLGISTITSLLVVPGAYLTARRHEREYLERQIADRRREEYERQLNREKGNVDGAEGETSRSETTITQPPRVSGEDGAQPQQGSQQSSGQSNPSQNSPSRQPSTNFLPPTGPTESNVLDRGGSRSGGVDQRIDQSSDTSSSSSNADPNDDSSADQSQSSSPENDAAIGQTSSVPVDEREVQEKSLEEILMEDGTT